MRLKRTACLFSYAVLFGGLACKQPTKPRTDLKSLENFAIGSDVRENQCAASPDVLEASDPRKSVTAFFDLDDKMRTEKVSAELFLALSAVPEDAFKLFAVARGKILVTDAAAKYCSFNGALKLDGKTPTFRSCLVDLPRDTGKNKLQKALEGTTLVVAADVAAIRHGVVRTFGYFIADFLARDQGFSKLRVALARAYDLDVAANPVFAAAKGKAAARKKPAEIENFMNYVVGEAFDSYYCRTGKGASYSERVAKLIKLPEDASLFAYLTDTRKVFEAFFPRTYKVFGLVRAHVAGAASVVPNLAKAKVKADAKSSLGLIETASERRVALEAQIAQHRVQMEDARKQFLAKKDNYDNSNFDVWGTKKSELDTAKAAYSFTENRSRILQQELDKAIAQETEEGANAQANSDRQFGKVETEVNTFDADKQLRTELKDRANVIGAAASENIGAAGRAADQLVGGDGTLGVAFGQGVGDGIGGTLSAIGKNIADKSESLQKKAEDAAAFAEGAIVDPLATGQKVADGVVKEFDDKVANAQNLAEEVYNGDTAALAGRAERAANDFIDSVPGGRSAATSAESLKVLTTGTDFNGKQVNVADQAEKQYEAAADAAGDVAGAVVGKIGDDLKGKVIGKGSSAGPDGASDAASRPTDPKIAGAIPTPERSTFQRVGEVAGKANDVFGKAQDYAEKGENGRGGGAVASTIDLAMTELQDTAAQDRVTVPDVPATPELSAFQAPASNDPTLGIQNLPGELDGPLGGKGSSALERLPGTRENENATLSSTLDEAPTPTKGDRIAETAPQDIMESSLALEPEPETSMAPPQPLEEPDSPAVPPQSIEEANEPEPQLEASAE